MTFKHSKFEDSVTMRSLEKIAIKHGLVTVEPRVKAASAKAQADYTPSNNLVENLLKLCAGLREMGFDKPANELEGKFIDYKRAFNAYETSKEKGEDLVDAAHPEGSHDLKGVEGDATVETIVDQHLKNLKVVEKKPTGKLASNKDVIKAIKLALAQDTNVIRKNLDSLKANVASVMRLYHSENVLGRPMSFAGGDLLELVNSTDDKTIDINKAKEIKASLADVKKIYSPGFLALSGVSAEAWEKMEPYFNSAQFEINEIIKALTTPAPSQDKAVPAATNVQNEFARSIFSAKSMIDRTIDKIKNYKGKVGKPGSQEQDIKELQNMLSRIDHVAENFMKSIKNPSLDPNQVAKESNDYLNEIVNTPGRSVNDYFKAWS